VRKEEKKKKKKVRVLLVNGRIALRTEPACSENA
jgi:hypothetical protein